MSADLPQQQRGRRGRDYVHEQDAGGGGKRKNKQDKKSTIRLSRGLTLCSKDRAVDCSECGVLKLGRWASRWTAMTMTY